MLFVIVLRRLMGKLNYFLWVLYVIRCFYSQPTRYTPNMLDGDASSNSHVSLCYLDR
jgi:hypothetical protein